jgi:CDP-glucose 4,6-dehydratase
MVELLASYWRIECPWVGVDRVTPSEERELRLDSSKASSLLGWKCRLPVPVAVEWVAKWYLRLHEGDDARQLCLEQIKHFSAADVTS